MKTLWKICLAVVAASAAGLGLLAADPPALKPISDLNPPEGYTLPWVDEETQCPPFGRPPAYPHQYYYYNPPPLYAGPRENRGEEYRKYLKVSVRMRNGNISGSGTIIHYDKAKKTAYVVSCGHLFRGGEKTIQVHAFYKNNTKLDGPAVYTATVLGVSSREDISLSSFTPDWDIDQCYPIAPVSYELTRGKTYFSCGCDGASEVACYLMKTQGIQGQYLIMVENGPRHGRSGGGLLTDDGYYVGICVRSSDPYNGTGQGLFVPLSRIHAWFKGNSFGHLLDQPKEVLAPARLLPIIDRTGPQGVYPKDYIPLP